MAIVLFLVGLTILLLSARYFTEGAERLGLSLNLSPFLIGVVIVAVGTSLPELVSAIIATSSGKPEIVVGNVIGANVSNIFLILGITTIFAGKNIYLGEEYLFIDLHFMLGSAALVGLFLWDGAVTWKEGIFLLIGFIVYQAHLIRSDKPENMREVEDGEVAEIRKKGIEIKTLLVIAFSALGVYLGAGFTVDSIVDIAENLNIDETYISLTALSLGTTLPELSVSISAAKQGKPQIALGNILGSCIFNAFVVVGVSSTIAPITIPASLQSMLLAFFLIASAFFYLLAHDKKISRWEGLLFLIFYAVFILKSTHVI